MEGLVAGLGVVVALLAVLVAGLLRSHAEILRELHRLGAGLDPDLPSDAAVTLRPSVQPRSPSDTRVAVDIAGHTPAGDAVKVSVVETDRLTLLGFLTTGCASCLRLWSDLAEPTRSGVPAGARLVVVTPGRDRESPARVAEVEPEGVAVVMSSEAWDAYGVPVAPYFVLVDGATSSVLGEGAAGTWDHVVSLVGRVAADAGLDVSEPGALRAPRGVTHAGVAHGTRRSRAGGRGDRARAPEPLPIPDRAVNELQGFGLLVPVPAGWEGRLFRRAVTMRDGRTARAFPVVHLATVPVGADAADYGGGIVEALGPRDAFVALKEFDPATARAAMFARAMPWSLEARDFDPMALQRRLRGQGGLQRFFREKGRAFCLYVVLGSLRERRRVVAWVDAILSDVRVEPLVTAAPVSGARSQDPS